jgi:hypothetical protein
MKNCPRPRKPNYYLLLRLKSNRSLGGASARRHITNMVNNLKLLRERLAEACRLRNTMFLDACRGLHLAPNRAYHLELRPENLTLTQLVHIAGALDMSLDYLLGRTDDPEAHKPTPRKAKARA